MEEEWSIICNPVMISPRQSPAGSIEITHDNCPSGGQRGCRWLWKDIIKNYSSRDEKWSKNFYSCCYCDKEFSNVLKFQLQLLLG